MDPKKMHTKCHTSCNGNSMLQIILSYKNSHFYSCHFMDALKLYKMVVDQIKKDMIKNWKMQRKRNLERNYVMKNVNVTGVPNNMKNKWRQAAANEALRRNKILTAKQFAALKKKWLKGMKNIIGNGNARRNIGAARARVETL